MLLVAGAVFIVPNYVDWNLHKENIEKAVENNTGYTISIDGDISLVTFPYPRLAINKVSLFSKEYKAIHENSAPLISLEKAEVEISLAELFAGKLSVSKIYLLEPDISLEIDGEGRSNWKVTTENNEEEQIEHDDLNTGVEYLAFNKVNIENGDLSFVDKSSLDGKNIKITDIDAQALVKSGFSDFYTDLSFNYDEYGVSASIATDLNAFLGNGKGISIPLNTEIAIAEAGIELKYFGLVSLSGGLEMQGEVFAEIKKPSDLRSEGLNVPEYLLGGQVAINGILTADKSGVNINDVAIKIADKFEAKGQVAINGIKGISDDDGYSVPKLRLSLNSDSVLDIGGLLPSRPASDEGGNSFDIGKLNDSIDSAVQKFIGLPIDIGAVISLAGVKYNKAKFDNFNFELSKEDKKISTKFFADNGNGDSQFNIESGARAIGSDNSVDYGIDAKFSSKNIFSLIETLGFLKSDNGNSEEIFPRFFDSIVTELSINKISDKMAIVFNDNVIKLDNSVFSLSGSYEFSDNENKDKLSLAVACDFFDLDKILNRVNQYYPPNPTGKQNESLQNKTAAFFDNVSVPFQVSFDLGCNSLTYNNDKIDSIRITGSIKEKNLSFNNISIGDFLGGKFVASAEIKDVTDLQDFELDIYGKIQNFPDFMAGINPEFANKFSGLGKSLGGTLAFDSDVVSVGGNMNSEVNIENDNIKSSLKVKIPGVPEQPKIDEATLVLEGKNLGKFLDMFAEGMSAKYNLSKEFKFLISSNINENGKYDLSGSGGNIGKTAFNSDLILDFSDVKPKISGNIKLNELAIDDYLNKPANNKKNSSVSGGRQTDSVMWSRKAIDASWMRLFDMNINYEAGKISYSSWVINNPSGSVILDNGNLSAVLDKAVMFNGNLTASADISSSENPREPVRINYESNLQNTQVDRVFEAMLGNKSPDMEGNVSAKLSLSTSGVNQAALISSLSGVSEINSENIVLNSFGINNFASNIINGFDSGDNISKMWDRSSGTGRTVFDMVNAKFTINQGKASIDNAVMDGSRTKITSSGMINLNDLSIDVTNTVTVKDIDGFPEFPLHIKGNLKNPVQTMGATAIEGFIKKKIDDQLNRVINKNLKKLSDPSEKSGDQTSDEKLPANDNQPKVEEQLIKGIINQLVR